MISILFFNEILFLLIILRDQHWTVFMFIGIAILLSGENNLCASPMTFAYFSWFLFADCCRRIPGRHQQHFKLWRGKYFVYCCLPHIHTCWPLEFDKNVETLVNMTLPFCLTAISCLTSESFIFFARSQTCSNQKSLMPWSTEWGNMPKRLAFQSTIGKWLGYSRSWREFIHYYEVPFRQIIENGFFQQSSHANLSFEIMGICPIIPTLILTTLWIS